MSWIFTLILTLIIEVQLAMALSPSGMRRRVALDATLLNLFTHPFLTVALRLGLLTWGPGEMVVWLAELVGYRLVTGLGWRRALLVSSVCNGVTMLIASAPVF